MRDDYDKKHDDISHIEMGGSNSSMNEQHYRSRLVHRNLPHGQSRNSPAVHIVGYKNVKWMLVHDWFHMVLRFPTSLSILILLLVWVLSIILFALIYRGIDGSTHLREECSLGGNETISFHTAFAFSLETCTTVGYGLPGSTNAFFEKCAGLQSIVCLQMIWSMMFNAFLMAFFFSRLARSEQRSVQVLFSKQAIIEQVNGKWLFHVRVYDVDSSKPLVEAHIRMYCASWKDYENHKADDETQPNLLKTMRLLSPDDELGSVLFPSIPSTVTHHIDSYSPLLPSVRGGDSSSPFWKDKGGRTGNTAGCVYNNQVREHGLVLREVDSRTGGRDGIICPVCGETYGTLGNLQRHVHYTAMVEAADDNFSVEGSHRDPELVPASWLPTIKQENDSVPLSPNQRARQNRKRLRKRQLSVEDRRNFSIDNMREHLRDKEIVCVLEGIEPMVSGTFQALQSYKVEDVRFGGRFAACMSREVGEEITVDLDRFHEILDPVDLLKQSKAGINFVKKKSTKKSSMKKNKDGWWDEVEKSNNNLLNIPT